VGQTAKATAEISVQLAEIQVLSSTSELSRQSAVLQSEATRFLTTVRASMKIAALEAERIVLRQG